MMKQFPFIAFFVCVFLNVSEGLAQGKEIVQFSGVVKAAGTEIEVPYVTITNKSFRNDIYMSNHEGYFTFVAHKGDVIEFASIGYETTEITIPQVDGDRYSITVEIQSKVEELPMVVVGPPLPWASIEEFTAEFLAMNPEGDEVLNARRNLSPEVLAQLSLILPRSAEEIYNQGIRSNHVRMGNKNMHQNALTPFLNPFAWGQFINQIKRGDYSRKKLKY